MAAQRKERKTPLVEDLEDPSIFEKILELNFNEMIPFVIKQIKRRSLVSLAYFAVNAGALLIILIYAGRGLSGTGLSENELTWSKVLRQSIAGIFAGSFLIIPFHEGVHALAYRLLGAKKIRFGADMQQLIFYVTVDRYPVSRNQLCFLAMLPFAMVNLLAIPVITSWAPDLALFILFLLLSHNIMCIGDFAMVNYARHVRGEVYTFDNVLEKTSYFFKRRETVSTAS